MLAGKYRVERILGEGAMGVVLLAHHLQLDERVAIKVPLPHVLYSPEASARFVREARAAVKIKSEHVAKVSDVGTLESGEPYIVMEYLEGQDLALLVERSALPIEQAVEFVLQACEALAEAHSLGIVHRDLKPANLFCIRRSDGLLAVKVLDFGISKVTSASPGLELGMTKVGVVMGSPLYMSPEQMESARDVDARSDIWAIGVILYELICSRPPFMADTLVALTLQIAKAAPAPVRSYRPDAPLELEGVILRCLAKDRSQRYANVAELAHALRPFGPKRARASVERISRVIQAAGLSPTALVLPPSSTPAVEANPAQTITEASFGKTALPLDGATRPWLFAGIGLLLLGAIGGLWLVGRSPSEIPHARASAVQPEPLVPAAPIEATLDPRVAAPKPEPVPATSLSPTASTAKEASAPTPESSRANEASAAAVVPSAKQRVTSTASAARLRTQPAIQTNAAAANASKAVSPPPIESAPSEKAPKPQASSAPPSPSAKSPSFNDMIGDR